MSDWVFNPGLMNGAPVKSSLAFTVSLLVDESGTVEQNFISGDFPPPPPPKKISKEEYFVAVEEMPEPIGGMQAVQKHIKYPELARKAGIQGRVFVKAYIDENGDVDNAEIIKGIGGGCDEVSMEAVYKTKFKPGKQRGENVKVQVTIPIVFKLDDKMSSEENK
ncbi:MAG: energy transducer TonB [Melioribacteraceae bacterium]|nr:energy transducer TonB [Melioribacteraceae bacterium]